MAVSPDEASLVETFERFNWATSIGEYPVLSADARSTPKLNELHPEIAARRRISSSRRPGDKVRIS
jgi:hypothetical protein